MKGFRGYQNPWVLILLLVIGGLLGSIVGELLEDSFPQILKPLVVGIDPPTTIDLEIISITVGVVVKLNLASVIGFLLAYFIYRKL